MRMILFLKSTLALMPLTCIHLNLSAQTVTADSLADIAGVEQAVKLYHNFLSPETGLYNGIEYVDYAYALKDGHPYFDSSEFKTGNIVYDGIRYENVKLLYDVVKDEVIIHATGYIPKLQLIKERVSLFSIENKKFVRLVEDSSSHSTIRTGFYNVLYDGSVKLYKKKIKVVQEAINTMVLEKYIIESEQYYFRNGNAWFPVNSRGSVLSALKDKKKEVQQFIKQNKLDIKHDKEGALKKIAAYYESITGGRV